MKRGRKADPPSHHAQRGTFQPSRHGNAIEILAANAVIEPRALPVQPDWLTAAGKLVWADDIGRISTTRMATELDSNLFGNYCNLQGAINLAFSAGAVPPAAYVAEARKMQELFGIGGARSRVLKTPGSGPTVNPFLRNGRK